MVFMTFPLENKTNLCPLKGNNDIKCMAQSLNETFCSEYSSSGMSGRLSLILTYIYIFHFPLLPFPLPIRLFHFKEVKIGVF